MSLMGPKPLSSASNDRPGSGRSLPRAVRVQIHATIGQGRAIRNRLLNQDAVSDIFRRPMAV